jgi:tetratricopeptide (TPR) repeat protein
MNCGAMTATDPPPSIATLQTRADALLRAGDVPGAIVAHQVLLDRAPERADGWYNLGYLQRCVRDFDAALISYDTALAHGASGAEAIHVNRAVILSEHLGRMAEGEAELRLALAANPRFLPAWLNMGQFAEDRGDATAARSAYAEAALLNPVNGRAHARLAALDVAEGEAEAVIPRLRALLKTTGIPQSDAAEIGFAMGQALDATGDYRGAFAALETANRIAKSLLPPPLRYDRAAHDGLIDAVIATFDGSARLAPAVVEGTAPIFICGMFRSGSTLCERLLAAHSRVTAGGELETIPAMVAGPLAPYPAAMQIAEIARLRAQYIGETKALFPQADVLTDKRCDNVLHIGLIKMMFPEARIIHTRREPMDNILSVWSLYFGDAAPYGFDLEDIVHNYAGYRRLMAYWERLYGADIFDFDYDRAVRDPATAMRELLAFCDLAPEDACLNGKPASGIVRTPSAWAVRQPVHARSSGRWHHYEDMLAPLAASLSQ